MFNEIIFYLSFVGENLSWAAVEALTVRRRGGVRRSVSVTEVTGRYLFNRACDVILGETSKQITRAESDRPRRAAALRY